MSTREKIATDIAEAYLGRPVEPDFLNGPATGGSVFYACADAALAAIGKPDKGGARGRPDGAHGQPRR